MEEQVTKKERKELKKQEDLEVQSQQTRNKRLQSIVLFVLGVILLTLIRWYLTRPTYLQPTVSLPGTAVTELGRNHVTDISGIVYTSFPPTSGPHFAVWAKRGVYPYQLSDGHLIHSLEHGYVVISYNCDTLGKKVTIAEFAKGDPFAKSTFSDLSTMAFFTPENNTPKQINDLPEGFTSASCKTLVGKLSKFLVSYQRLIIVPRPGLDTKIALTAWGRIEKLSEYKEKEITAFLDAFQNQGPEKTIE